MRKFQKVFIVLLCLCGFQIVNAGWIKQNSNTFAWLRDIYFLNEKTGWISGSGGTFLKTEDGGKSWSQTEKFTDDNILQIFFADSNNGFLLCERNVYSLGAKMPSYLLKTSDGGKNWERVEFAENGRGRITKFLFDAYGTGFAFGEAGTFYKLANTENDWKKMTSPTRYLLFDGVFNDQTNGVVVGAGGTILFTNDAGLSWNQANIFGDKTAKFNAVCFSGQKNGWTVGNSGKIFQTISGGKTWREQSSGVTKNLNDVFFINSAEGFAVGDDGIILHTTTAGNVWATENPKAAHKLEKVYFVGKKGFAVGFGGTVLTFDEKAKDEKIQIKPILQRRN